MKKILELFILKFTNFFNVCLFVFHPSFIMAFIFLYPIFYPPTIFTYFYHFLSIFFILNTLKYFFLFFPPHQFLSIQDFSLFFSYQNFKFCLKRERNLDERKEIENKNNNWTGTKIFVLFFFYKKKLKHFRLLLLSLSELLLLFCSQRRYLFITNLLAPFCSPLFSLSMPAFSLFSPPSPLSAPLSSTSTTFLYPLMALKQKQFNLPSLPCPSLWLKKPKKNMCATFSSLISY